MLIGGTTAVPDLISGAVIVHLINATPTTSQHKNMHFDTELKKESGSSLYDITYQIDIYKQNSPNLIHRSRKRSY